MNNYGFSNEKALQAVEFYREYYRETGVYENDLYDGIVNVIKSLKQSGKTVILATSKPKPFAVQILKQYNLLEFFDFVIGATFDGTLNYKNDVIRVAIKESGITDKTKALMVGDRNHDILGANENGIDSLGVLYGFGDLEELQKAGATYITDNTNEILTIIRSKDV